MTLGIVKIYLACPSQPIGVVHSQFVRDQFVVVSCRGTNIGTVGLPLLVEIVN